jgi:multisubunit Na+/H+ antiporter MnhB subunit
MSICNEVSLFQLLIVAVAFLLAVLWLDIYWVRIPQALEDEETVVALKRQRKLNALVALGAVAGALLLIIWTASRTPTGI